jgi:hypothetical protein
MERHYLYDVKKKEALYIEFAAVKKIKAKVCFNGRFVEKATIYLNNGQRMTFRNNLGFDKTGVSVFYNEYKKYKLKKKQDLESNIAWIDNELEKLRAMQHKSLQELYISQQNEKTLVELKKLYRKDE